MTEQATPTPDDILAIKDELLARWHALPLEHQATMGLIILREVVAGEWGGWLMNALRVHDSADQQASTEPLVVRSLTTDDLRDAGVSDADMKTLTAEDLDLITRRVQEHLTLDVLPDEIYFLAEGILDKKRGKAP